ncbi:DapH/DapD/GlmU-related protein [Fusibacter sp. 3D3]|uniref:DapH/DapD/GlmU-related protein n=1 Tax=Fusibacter sp. 3D3 TaxID=1048380 RepID=UPI001FA7A2B7|nr:DapH/DapD/GlmU-related protein [Fusibacter sp. 3D3]
MFDITQGNYKKLIIGNNCKIGDYVHIAAGEKVIIGNNCLMASKIYISDISHGCYKEGLENDSPDIPPDRRLLATDPVIIGNNVWIGENVSILSGITIGDGCIVGANSVVTKNVPKHTIVAGVPAKVIKVWNKESELWIKS